jgi:hypothetical protein
MQSLGLPNWRLITNLDIHIYRVSFSILYWIYADVVLNAPTSFF